LLDLVRITVDQRFFRNEMKKAPNWNAALSESKVVTAYTATDDKYEVTIEVNDVVRILSLRSDAVDGWSVICFNDKIGCVPTSCLALSTAGYDSSSTSNEDDNEEENWLSPESKTKRRDIPKSLSQLAYHNFIQSPKRALSPRHKEFKEKVERMNQNTPPPLPARRHSSHTNSTFKLSSPPPMLPSRRNSSFQNRKFTEQINRRESLSSLENKYKPKTLSLCTSIEEESQKDVIEVISPRKAKKNAIQVNMVCNEIIETERDYVNDLNTVVNNYLIPLRQQINLGHMGISKKDGNTSIDEIFSNIESIQQTNSLLLSKLTEHMNKDSESDDEEDDEKGVEEMNETKDTTSLVRTICHAFESVMEYFKMYSVYCVGYNRSIQCLSKFRSNQMLDRFLDRCSSTTTTNKTLSITTAGHIQLSSLLIKPIQRLCKYPLFFRDLLKFVPKYHNDRMYLEKVSKLVNHIILLVNNKVKSTDQSNAVILASYRLQGTVVNLVQPQRRLLLEDDSVHIQHDKKLRITCKKYTMMIFNDLILFAKFDKKVRNISSNGRRRKKKNGDDAPKFLRHKHSWLMKNISVKGEQSAYDPRHGWPFYIMKRINIVNNDNDDNEYGTTVERFKLFASTKEKRAAIVETIKECQEAINGGNH
jgi:hypothetical protein